MSALLAPIFGSAFAASTAGTIIGTGLDLAATAGISKALSPGMPKQAASPQTTTMPTADDAAIQRAQRAAIAKQMARGGRQSTILTDQSSQTLGGGL